jgi:hypothetical protein
MLLRVRTLLLVAEGIGIGIWRHRHPCLAMGMIRWVDSNAICSDRSPRFLPLVGRIIRLLVLKTKFSQRDNVNNIIRRYSLLVLKMMSE